jgi:vesicle transport through interaction with t-SNAREs 1
MDLEARSLQPSVRAGLLAKLREYKSDLNNLKSELKHISSVGPTPGAREDLLESGMSDTLVVNYTASLFNLFVFFLLLLIHLISIIY